MAAEAESGGGFFTQWLNTTDNKQWVCPDIKSFDFISNYEDGPWDSSSISTIVVSCETDKAARSGTDVTSYADDPSDTPCSTDDLEKWIKFWKA